MALAPKLGAGAGASTGRRAVPLPMKVGTGGNAATSTGVRGLRGTGRKVASASLANDFVRESRVIQAGPATADRFAVTACERRE